MSSSDENTEIRARYNLLRDPLIPVSWPNTSFVVPNPAKIYARFSIVSGEPKQVDFGSHLKTFRNVGIIYISLFSPPGTGDGLVKVSADAVAAIFRNWCGSTVRCRAPAVKSLGEDKATGWYQVNVSIPFQRDEQL